jgi:branched-chain amino acid transport system substrate-binding protein
MFTGEAAIAGNASRNGIDLAVKEINQKGGINGKRLVVDHQDNQGVPSNAVSIFNNHLSRGINIFLGTTWSPSAIALKEVVCENQVLMFSPSVGASEVNEECDYIFNNWQHDFYLSRDLADLVYQEGHRKIVVVGAKQAWVDEQTMNFSERFLELDGKIVLLVEPLMEQKDFSSEALKIKNLKEVDAIVYTAGPSHLSALLSKKLKETGVSLPQYSITLNSSTIEASQGAFNDLVYLIAFTPTEEFEDKYIREYNINIEVTASESYDAVMMIAEAMEKTGSTDPTILKDYLNNIDHWDGASGYLTSNGKGAFKKESWMMKIIDGKSVRIS